MLLLSILNEEQPAGTLSEKHAHVCLPPEELVNRIGYKFLRTSEITQTKIALQFFQLNAKNYPKSYNAFDS